VRSPYSTPPDWFRTSYRPSIAQHDAEPGHLKVLLQQQQRTSRCQPDRQRFTDDVIRIRWERRAPTSNALINARVRWHRESHAPASLRTHVASSPCDRDVATPIPGDADRDQLESFPPRSPRYPRTAAYLNLKSFTSRVLVKTGIPRTTVTLISPGRVNSVSNVSADNVAADRGGPVRHDLGHCRRSPGVPRPARFDMPVETPIEPHWAIASSSHPFDVPSELIIAVGHRGG